MDYFIFIQRKIKILAEEMAENHLLITEYPPYMRPEKWTFPMRNRIISGLSEAFVVTEAAVRSGTIITTEHALRARKRYFCGSRTIFLALSEGTNKLIEEGAKPVWNGYQIVENYSFNYVL